MGNCCTVYYIRIKKKYIQEAFYPLGCILMHFEKRRRRKRKNIFSTRISLLQQRDAHYKFQNGKQLDSEVDTFLKSQKKQ